MKKTVKNYMILSSEDRSLLQDAINAYLGKGYGLVGGVSATAVTSIGASVFRYTQAIAIFEDKS